MLLIGFALPKQMSTSRTVRYAGNDR